MAKPNYSYEKRRKEIEKKKKKEEKRLRKLDNKHEPGRDDADQPDAESGSSEPESEPEAP